MYIRFMRSLCFRISNHRHILCSTSLLFHPSFLLIFLGSLIELIVITYYSYDYCQAQLEEALNDDRDEDHFARQMVDAFKW